MKFYSIDNGICEDGSTVLAYFTTLKKAWAFNVKRLRQVFKENKAAAIENKISYLRNYCRDRDRDDAKQALARIKAEKFSLPYGIDCEPGNMVAEHHVKPGVRALVRFLNGGSEMPGIHGDDLGVAPDDDVNPYLDREEF